MKKNLFICIIALVFILGGTSCQREVRSITGDYSYKLSGEVTVTNNDGEISYLMVNKRGQMNILRDKSASDRVTITMNESAGGAYSFTATIKGDSLLLDPYQFSTNILTGDNVSPFQDGTTLVFRIDVAGRGVRNDNIILIEENWSGQQSSGNSRLEGNKMVLLAEKNE